MEREDVRYQAYVQILKEELVPAMGCTEPIAIAYAAAKTREILGGFGFDSIEKILDNIFKTYPLGDDFLVGDKDSWFKVLEQLGEFNNLTAQLLFQYFLFDIKNWCSIRYEPVKPYL